MKKSLTLAIVLIFCILSSVLGIAGGGYTQKTIRAELIKVSGISEFKGQTKLAHFDPMFVISLKLEHGAIENYQIHSPTKLLGHDYKVGKKYKFSITYYPSRVVNYEIRRVK